jgi:hypothetical protein
MMSDKRTDRAAARDDPETLPLGMLPHITDTDPPPVHPDTVAGPPSVVDVPYAEQSTDGTQLTCTTGNWTGVPTSYAYQWQLDGDNRGDNTATYVVGSGDVGKSAVCIVTATNALGATDAPPSNAVTIAAGGTRQAQQEHAGQR